MVKKIKGFKFFRGVNEPNTQMAVKEESEQIDELSQEKLKTYKKYATLRAVGQAMNIYDREVEGGKKPDPKQHAALAKTNKGLDRANARIKEESELDEGTYSADVERAFPGGKASGVKTHPVAPVPDKKYIKGTQIGRAHV